MAVQEHFEGFDQAPDEQSRSAHKREAQALRKLVEKGVLKEKDYEVFRTVEVGEKNTRNIDDVILTDEQQIVQHIGTGTTYRFDIAGNIRTAPRVQLSLSADKIGKFRDFFTAC